MYSNTKLEINTLFFGSLPLVYAEFFATKNFPVFPNHWHKRFEIIRIRSGVLKLTLVNNSHILKAGDICFINSIQSHTGISLSDDLSYDIIQIKKSTIEEYAKEFKPFTQFLNNKFQIEQIFQDEYIFNFFTRLQSLYKSEDYLSHTYLYKALIYELFAYLTLYHSSNNHIRIYNPVFYDIIDYIDKHFNENLTIKQLAEKSSFNISYFSHKFKEYTGIPPIQYIIDCRLKASVEMLLHTKQPIDIISQECGFENTSYFIKMFRKKYNVTPKEFRKNNTSSSI